MPDAKFLEEYPLYRKFDFKLPSYFQEIKDVNINMYCPNCEEARTFRFSHKYLHEKKNPVRTRVNTAIFPTIKQSPEKTRKFFGRSIKPNEINKEKLTEIYVDQLKRMGFKLEQIRVNSGIGFFYTLLFCCRSNVGAKWLRRYKEYSENQFKHFTGEQLKSFWDRATGRVNGLDKYIFKNKS